MANKVLKKRANTDKIETVVHAIYGNDWAFLKAFNADKLASLPKQRKAVILIGAHIHAYKVAETLGNNAVHAIVEKDFPWFDSNNNLAASIRLATQCKKEMVDTLKWFDENSPNTGNPRSMWRNWCKANNLKTNGKKMNAEELADSKLTATERREKQQEAEKEATKEVVADRKTMLEEKSTTEIITEIAERLNVIKIKSNKSKKNWTAKHKKALADMLTAQAKSLGIKIG